MGTENVILILFLQIFGPSSIKACITCEYEDVFLVSPFVPLHGQTKSIETLMLCVWKWRSRFLVCSVTLPNYNLQHHCHALFTVIAHLSIYLLTASEIFHPIFFFNHEAQVDGPGDRRWEEREVLNRWPGG